MKKIKMVFAVMIAGCFLLSGCSSYLPKGSIYTGVKEPITAGARSVKYSKVDKAEAKTVLGIVATSDFSIATAAKNGGMTRIKYVDWEVESILGIGTYTTTVYGDCPYFQARGKKGSVALVTKPFLYISHTNRVPQAERTGPTPYYLDCK